MHSSSRLPCLLNGGLAQLTQRPTVQSTALSRLDQAVLVGEHHSLDSVAQTELGDHAPNVGLDRGLAHVQLLSQLVVAQAATSCLSTSRSRSVSADNTCEAAEPESGAAKRSISRRVIEGARRASPAARIR